MTALVATPVGDSVPELREANDESKAKPSAEIFTDSSQVAELDQFSPTTKISTIFYIQPQALYESEKPYFLNVPAEPGSGLAQTNVNYTRKSVKIFDVRCHEGLFELDKNGFQLRTFNSALSYDDFADPTAIATRYYPEVQNFLQQSLGATEILPFDYQVRRRDPSLPQTSRGAPGKAQPFASVHADQSAAAAMRRLEYFHPNHFDKYKDCRVQIVNVWKPLRGPVFDAPLAVCDYRTVDNADRVPTDVIFPDYLGETYNFWPNPKHRWYFIDGQMHDEAWSIKCFDTMTSTNPEISQFAPHVSFRYPNPPADAFARESIEVRSFVFYA